MVFLALFLTSLASCRTVGGFGAIPVHLPSTEPDTKIEKTPARELNWSAQLQTAAITVATEFAQVKNCELLKEFSITIPKDIVEREGYLIGEAKVIAVETDADTIIKKEASESSKQSSDSAPIQAYLCSQAPPSLDSLIKSARDDHRNEDLSFFGGSYFSRQGILRELGGTGPTLGLSYTNFSIGGLPKIGSYSNFGIFALWTYDHFWETNGNLLKPKFFDEDYTNYMLAFGIAFRYIFWERLQLHLKSGMALNFIEIDTFGAGTPEQDKQYSDLTISTVHKLGLNYLINAQSNPFTTGQVRIGPSLLYYYAPNPLGKFSNDEKPFQTGGSLAWSLDVIFEFY